MVATTPTYWSVFWTVRRRTANLSLSSAMRAAVPLTLMAAAMVTPAAAPATAAWGPAAARSDGELRGGPGELVSCGCQCLGIRSVGQSIQAVGIAEEHAHQLLRRRFLHIHLCHGWLVAMSNYQGAGRVEPAFAVRADDSPHPPEVWIRDCAKVKMVFWRGIPHRSVSFSGHHPSPSRSQQQHHEMLLPKCLADKASIPLAGNYYQDG